MDRAADQIYADEQYAVENKCKILFSDGLIADLEIMRPVLIE